MNLLTADILHLTTSTRFLLEIAVPPDNKHRNKLSQIHSFCLKTHVVFHTEHLSKVWHYSCKTWGGKSYLDLDEVTYLCI